jgi:hypothetical protein
LAIHESVVRALLSPSPVTNNGPAKKVMIDIAVEQHATSFPG